MNAIILAAGFGARLRPLTDIMPKPLIPLFGSPMLAIVTANLKNAGIDQIAINTHYLSEQITAAVSHFSEADSIELFHESEILGTGGGVANAKSLLIEHGSFLIHNSDILTDFNLSAMIEEHRASGAKITMAVLDGPENRVRVTADGQIHDILDSLGRNPGGRLLTYGGVMIVSRTIFDYLPETPENFSVIRAVLDMMRDIPDAVRAHVIENCYWRDLGTLPEYFSAHADAIAGKIHLPILAECRPVWFKNGAQGVENATLNGFVVGGENCVIGANSTLTNCILLDDTMIPPDSFHNGELLGPNGLSLHRDHRQLASYKILERFKNAPYSISSLIECGSVRGFYRIKQNGKSVILMISDGMDQDYDRFVIIGRFLAENNFQTPKILAFNADEYTILVEDLGNETLYELVQRNGVQAPETERLYRMAIDELIDFQVRGLDLFRQRSAPILRTFDKSYLRWESAYFCDNFLGAYCGVSSEERSQFNATFDSLAILTATYPKVLIHRDFQSQNLLLHDGRICFVDFQGARFGSLGYDIMSLLNDPYTALSLELRMKLEHYFREQISLKMTLDSVDLEEMMIVSGLQRSLQALGAYGFLALTQGKRHYLNFIPGGFSALLTGLDRLHKLPSPPLDLSDLAYFLEALKLPQVAKINQEQ